MPACLGSVCTANNCGQGGSHWIGQIQEKPRNLRQLSHRLFIRGSQHQQAWHPGVSPPERAPSPYTGRGTKVAGWQERAQRLHYNNMAATMVSACPGYLSSVVSTSCGSSAGEPEQLRFPNMAKALFWACRCLPSPHALQGREIVSGFFFYKITNFI